MTQAAESGHRMMPEPARPLQHFRLSLRLVSFLLLGTIAVAALCALGVWQLERRVWKLALIERVETRAHAAPAAAPGPDAWPQVTAAGDEYRRVRLDGRFLNDRETSVRASTELGSGYWILTPFRTDQGFTVLVNRGFVPPERRDPATRAATAISGETSVVGLLRMTEPKGGFLRQNVPAQDRWYSRDIAAIAARRGIAVAAPYFVDAEATPGPGQWPRGGLTRLVFPNNHLVYALTWFGLALGLGAAMVALLREERGRRRRSWSTQ